MKTKKGRIILIIFILFVTLLIISFIVYRQTALLRQRMDNIESFTVIQINHHEENFEIILDNPQHVETFYNILTSTETRRDLFPNYIGSISHRVDAYWVFNIHYKDGQSDEIFVSHNALFFRLLPTRSSVGGFGTVSGQNVELTILLIELFEERGFDEIPRFRGTQISPERWDSPLRFYESNNDFTFLIGEEVYTFEHAVDVANVILEMEQIDNFDFNRYELVLVEYDEDAKIWLFSFWINDTFVISSSLRIAFDGNTGEIIQMWEE